ncbi:MAG: GTPase [Gemmataceae bacterium]
MRLPGVTAPLPADLYYFAGPASYTGQDVAELHTLGCPPLVERDGGCCWNSRGVGRRSRRVHAASVSGGQARPDAREAVHAVVEATTRGDLKHALTQLAGGMATPLQTLREDLLDLLADVEAGLDFADEDIRFVDPTELLLRLGRALAQVTLVGKQLDSRAVAGASYRIVLTGRPNAGKSSLFNRLAGTAALVSAVPGTTRDYLTASLTLAGVKAELVDTPGWQPPAGTIDAQPRQLGRAQQRDADLLLLCVDAGAALLDEDITLLESSHPPVLRVATKADAAAAPEGWLPTSATTGAGSTSCGVLSPRRCANVPPRRWR